MKNSSVNLWTVVVILTISSTNLFAQNNEATEINVPKQKISDKVKIADWYGFAKAAYSLSFDDGMISHYKYVAPVLDKYGLKATFYIVSENLESDSLASPKWRNGYWYQFIEMHSKGHEIASHSATHPRLTALREGAVKESGTLQYELTEPIRALKKNIPNYKSITFAYPYVDFSGRVEEETAKHYYSSRGLGSGFNPVHPADWMNIQAHTISYNGGRTIASDQLKIKELENWIVTTTIAKGGWTVYLAHDVFPFEEAITANDSWHPVSIESLDPFIQWLKDKQKSNVLWIETVGNVTRYCKERDDVTIVQTLETANKIIFSITDNLPNDLFNFPLTLLVNVPIEWKKVKVKQKNTKNTLEVIDGKIIVNAIPDEGDIEISQIN